jgi:hypothetical protein
MAFTNARRLFNRGLVSAMAALLVLLPLDVQAVKYIITVRKGLTVVQQFEVDTVEECLQYKPPRDMVCSIVGPDIWNMPLHDLIAVAQAPHPVDMWWDSIGSQCLLGRHVARRDQPSKQCQCVSFPHLVEDLHCSEVSLKRTSARLVTEDQTDAYRPANLVLEYLDLHVATPPKGDLSRIVRWGQDGVIGSRRFVYQSLNRFDAEVTPVLINVFQRPAQGPGGLISKLMASLRLPGSGAPGATAQAASAGPASAGSDLEWRTGALPDSAAQLEGGVVFHGAPGAPSARGGHGAGRGRGMDAHQKHVYDMFSIPKGSWPHPGPPGPPPPALQ